MSEGFVFKRMQAGTYRATMVGIDVVGTVTRVHGHGWIVSFSDNEADIFRARTRIDARLVSRFYLDNGTVPDGMFDVVREPPILS